MLPTFNYSRVLGVCLSRRKPNIRQANAFSHSTIGLYTHRRYTTELTSERGAAIALGRMCRRRTVVMCVRCTSVDGISRAIFSVFMNGVVVVSVFACECVFAVHTYEQYYYFNARARPQTGYTTRSCAQQVFTHTQPHRHTHTQKCCQRRCSCCCL